MEDRGVIGKRFGDSIDMDGHEVHRWDKWGFPSEILDPAITGGKKGELLVQLTNAGAASGVAPAPFGGIFTNRTIGELDWNGNIVWEWGERAPGGAARQNHDWARLPNGNTIIVATVDRVIPSLSKQPVGDLSANAPDANDANKKARDDAWARWKTLLAK